MALANRAALLTCVSNLAGVGPGHSAVVVDSYVFTFERVWGAWRVSNRSAWVKIRTKDYLNQNRHRPVVILELAPGRVNASAIRGYIAASDAADADYLSSGVCSHLAAQAISAGVKGTVNPWGLNTPYRVYRYVKSMGCVSKSYYTFPHWYAYPTNGSRKFLLHSSYIPESWRYVEQPDILRW